MDIKIDVNKNHQHTKIIIQTPEKTDNVKNMISKIRQLFHQVTIYDHEKTYQINMLDIVYIESVEGKTFIYTQNKIFEDPRPLYTFEKLLTKYYFIRINKHTIINPRYIVSVKALLYSRYELNLSTSEKLIVTRHYRNHFKKIFEKGGIFHA